MMTPAEHAKAAGLEDVELVRACVRGEGQAWERLIRRHRRLVYSIPSSYRLGPDEADEVFQRVAVLLYQNLKTLRNERALPAWLIVTARRECQALLRQRGRWAPLEDARPDTLVEDPPDVAKALDLIRQKHILELAFERLDPECCGLLTALYREEPRPSYREISRRLGRPVGALGPTRARCLSKLKGIFRRLDGAAP